MARLIGHYAVDVMDCMTWPACGDAIADLGWKLRYAPEEITRGETLVLASLVDAYTQMVNDPQKHRNAVCREIREASAAYAGGEE